MTNLNAPASATLHTKREAALYFKIGARTLDDWMKKGKLPYVKIGKLVRFRQSDLDRTLEKFLISG
jgi:excisionase family DNA binding protein